jgi:Arc/MetJ family transcription regulator
MAATLTSIRLDTELADEAAKLIGVNSRTDAIHRALRELVSTQRFKNVLMDYGGKGSFAGADEESR